MACANGRTRLLYATVTGMDSAELEAEQEAASALQGLWLSLEELAEQVDGGLYTVKADFAKTTKEQVRACVHTALCLLARAVNAVQRPQRHPTSSLLLIQLHIIWFFFCQTQVVEFQAATAAFLARLLEQGPGRHAADLPAGLEALRQFQKQTEAMAKQREQLALAEHLFDLEQTFYLDLSKVRAGTCGPLKLHCHYPQRLRICFFLTMT